MRRFFVHTGPSQTQHNNQQVMKLSDWFQAMVQFGNNCQFWGGAMQSWSIDAVRRRRPVVARRSCIERRRKMQLNFVGEGEGNLTANSITCDRLKDCSFLAAAQQIAGIWLRTKCIWSHFLLLPVTVWWCCNGWSRSFRWLMSGRQT